MEVDAAVGKEVPLWKISRFVWASFFWSQFFPSIFSFPWYIKDLLIAHTNFSVINYGFLFKVIICVPARSTVLTNTASEPTFVWETCAVKVPWSLGRGGWRMCEPGAWWRCSQCAHFPASLSFEIWRPSWSDQLSRREKRWISPEIGPLIDESWHRSGYMANYFHKWNWKVLKVKRVGEWFISGKKTLVGSFGRYYFAGYENPHSCML